LKAFIHDILGYIRNEVEQLSLRNDNDEEKTTV